MNDLCMVGEVQKRNVKQVSSLGAKLGLGALRVPYRQFKAGLDDDVRF